MSSPSCAGCGEIYPDRLGDGSAAGLDADGLCRWCATGTPKPDVPQLSAEFAAVYDMLSSRIA